MQNSPSPLVGVIMGSRSDWKVMKGSKKILDKFQIPHEVRILSAHRTPDLVSKYVKEARERGILVVISGAGGSAHLPGMAAADADHVPIIGVPIDQEGSATSGEHALHSIVHMPTGVPVGTMGINAAENAAIYAAQMLSMNDAEILHNLRGYRLQMRNAVLQSEQDLLSELSAQNHD